MSSYVRLETRTRIGSSKYKYIIKIDKEDHQWISQLAVYVARQRTTLGLGVTYKDYIGETIDESSHYTLSRKIMGLNSDERNYNIRYINSDALDLRKENLEIVLISQKLLEENRYKERLLPKGVHYAQR